MDVGVAIPTCKEGLSSPVGFARPEQVIEVIVRAILHSRGLYPSEPARGWTHLS